MHRNLIVITHHSFQQWKLPFPISTIVCTSVYVGYSYVFCFSRDLERERARMLSEEDDDILECLKIPCGNYTAESSSGLAATCDAYDACLVLLK